MGTDSMVGVSQAEVAELSTQLGRPARGVRAVVARCRPGHPAVVETEPRLPDGTPFPTVFYLTCPTVASAVGTLEASGMMTRLTARLAEEPELAAAYRSAHETYLAHREAIAHVPQIAGISAGGMPDRVKCLHALVGHSLAAGPGVNPIGDLAIEALAELGCGGGSCG